MAALVSQKLVTTSSLGQAGNRVRIDADRTGGLINTEIILVDPDFIDETNTQPGGDLLDHVLQKRAGYLHHWGPRRRFLTTRDVLAFTFLNLTAGLSILY